MNVPTDLVAMARARRAPIITSTYNEPLITSEWAVDVFREAKKAGLVCSYVSNGNGTPEVLDYIAPYISMYKVDLKEFSTIGRIATSAGRCSRVLWTIRALHERGFWLEIVTLVVPGFNDSNEELREIARFLVSVSPDIPWHVTAFHQDYKMTDNANTTARHLLRAYEIGKRAGLRYIYPGNIPGGFGDREGTHCPKCDALVIGQYRVPRHVISARRMASVRNAQPGSRRDGTAGVGAEGVPRRVSQRHFLEAQRAEGSQNTTIAF